MKRLEEEAVRLPKIAFHAAPHQFLWEVPERLGYVYQMQHCAISICDMLAYMRLISNRALISFATIHPTADVPLQSWRKAIEAGQYSDFAALKKTFNAVDKVGLYYVFNVGGNKYRVVVSIHFNSQVAYIRHVFTHKEYDKWKP